MAQSFTFLNTTNAPSLTTAETRLMRAHVTKTNFRKRRRRLMLQHQVFAKSGPLQNAGTVPLSYNECEYSARYVPKLLTPGPSLFGLPNHLMESSARFLIEEFRPLIFPSSNGSVSSASEMAWINLIISEPALVEASMSVASLHWARGDSDVAIHPSDRHLSNAVAMINKRLDVAATALTDGVLGAVFMLSFNERLARNEMAWRIHVQGLSQMVKQRRLLAGNESIPVWFSDLLLYETINDGITKAPLRYQSVVAALRDEGSQSFVDMSRAGEYIAKLHDAITTYYSKPEDSNLVKFEMESLLADIYHEIHRLGDKGSYFRAFACAFRVYLLLIWPPQMWIDWAREATELKEALEQPKMRLCGSIELTMWQFFIGSVAAESNPDIRDWFMNRLRRLFMAARIHRWEDALKLLERVFIQDEQLIARFRQVWTSVNVYGRAEA